MPDVWAAFSELDADTQERLAGVLETRGADPQQQEMRRAFLADISFLPDARVLEVGCGTGVLTRELALRPGVGAVVGVDAAPSLLGEARERAAGLPDLAFREADARSLPFGDGTFDAVVFYTTLSHVPGPERALAEAFRVLRPKGHLAAFDGDYATGTVALGDHDPLQACLDAIAGTFVHDRWLARRLPALVRGGGFEEARLRGHSFVETDEAGYMLGIVDRAIVASRASGRFGEDMAEALKSEARRRVEAGTFFGHIAYVSLVARKPA
jgi:SAM-dependent methyltransferase